MTLAHIVLGAPLSKPLDLNTYDVENSVFIGVDRGALHLIDNGINPDLAIGDFDSITLEEKARVKKQSEIFRAFDAEKDDTDTELALLQTIALFNPDSITVHNWSGGRIDHFISHLFLVLQPRFYEIVPILSFVNSENTISFYLPGEHTVKKEDDKEYLSYIAMTNVKGLTLSNVKYTLVKKDFFHPIALVSNEFLEETALFSFEEGIIAVIQSKDSK